MIKKLTNFQNQSSPNIKLIASALTFGIMVVLLDSTILVVATDTLMNSLNQPLSTVQWVNTGYMLAIGVTIPFVGFLESKFGSKNLWLIAMCLFTLGSLFCAFAWNVESLIFFRILQGIGGGILMPLMQNIVVKYAKKDEVTRALGYVALPAAIGPVLGPFLGGLILNWFSWNWIFIINIPFCLIGLVLAVLFVPKDTKSVSTKIDILGAIYLPIALGFIFYGLSNTHKPGTITRNDVWIFLSFGFIFLIAFVLHAWKLKDKALVNLIILKKRSLFEATFIFFIFSIMYYGGNFLFPLFEQNVNGFSPLEAGSILIPQGVGILFVRFFIGKFTEKYGANRVLFASFVLILLGTIPFGLVVDSENSWLIVLSLFVRGLGGGAVLVPILSLAYNDLLPNEVAHGSTLTRTVQQLGSALGTAFFAILLEYELTKYINTDTEGDKTAYQHSFIILIIVTLLTLVFTGFAQRKK